MNTHYKISARFCLLLLAFAASLQLRAQEPAKPAPRQPLTAAGADTLHVGDREQMAAELPMAAQLDTISLAAADSTRRHKRDWTTWRPSPKRALWLALVLPGAGQIYNRKYWKLPLIYGGFVGCAYAMRWNNMMYRDYSQAYLDIMDSDPKTQSYNQFLHLGTTISDNNVKQWQEIFRKRKDRYRRWRDLSFFVMVGVYALSVVDAYVDASLSEFDISPDLSLRVAPAVMGQGVERGQLQHAGLGLQCSLNF